MTSTPFLPLLFTPTCKSPVCKSPTCKSPTCKSPVCRSPQPKSPKSKTNFSGKCGFLKLILESLVESPVSPKKTCMSSKSTKSLVPNDMKKKALVLKNRLQESLCDIHIETTELRESLNTYHFGSQNDSYGTSKNFRKLINNYLNAHTFDISSEGLLKEFGYNYFDFCQDRSISSASCLIFDAKLEPAFMTNVDFWYWSEKAKLLQRLITLVERMFGI